MAVAPILLIGDGGDLADEVRQALDALEAEVVRLVEPTQREVEAVFARGPIERAVVIARQDAFALRMALMVRDADEDVELLITYFDPATAGQLAESIGNCRTTSLADVTAPALAGPCLDESLGALKVRDGRAIGVVVDDDHADERVVEVPRRSRARATLLAVLTPYDRSAALMFFGALGLLVVLFAETFSAMAVLGQGFVDALYGSAKTLVTVDPNDPVTDGPKAYKVVVTVLMLVALVLEALFTAGVVNRLIDTRLTGLFGRRAVPRRDHVIVVGLGEVGLRLCLLLRDAGIGVVGVDDRERGSNAGRARDEGLPVVIGRGDDPTLLRRVSLGRAMALASVTDDDLVNVAVAMAARSVEPDIRTVLRVGDGRLANETRSLVRVGIVRDVHRIAAALIAAQATGSTASSVVCLEEEARLVHDDGRVDRAAIRAAA